MGSVQGTEITQMWVTFAVTKVLAGKQGVCAEMPKTTTRKEVRSVFPDGTEQQANSSDKSLVSSSGAAESAALDRSLAAIVRAWPTLDERSKDAIFSVASRAIQNAARASQKR